MKLKAKPRRLAGVARVISGVTLLMLATSCGYRTGLGPSSPPQPLPETALDLAEGTVEALNSPESGLDGSRSIGIQIFGNESQVPNLERELHAAFTRAARRHASMRLVAPRHADLYIRGRIAGFRRGTGARTTGNQVVETLEILTIEAELVDGATGRVLGRAPAQPIVGTAIDVPGREAETRDRALANAADRLLLLLLAGLEYGVTRPGDPLLPEFRTPTRQSGSQSQRPEMDEEPQAADGEAFVPTPPE
ncbi:MAG: LPS assembly lipoprotein LptE [Planctomycetota bacterium]